MTGLYCAFVVELLNGAFNFIKRRKKMCSDMINNLNRRVKWKEEYQNKY